MTHKELASLIADAVKSRHGADINSAIEQILRMHLPGDTGEFPGGKLNENDGGEIAMAIGIAQDHKTIIIDFGKNLSWIGMTSEGVVEFIRGLQKTVDKLTN